MNTRLKIILATGGAAVAILAGMSVPAQAADCKYDRWGSSQWSGQKYKCPDGSSMYIKPPSYSGDSWDSTPSNPWNKWQGKDNQGNRYDCTWDNWRKSWKCR